MIRRPCSTLGRLSLLAIAAASLVACESSQLRITPLPEMVCDIQVTPVDLPGGMQGYIEPGFFVVEDETEWCAVLAQLGEPLPCDTSLVDFSSEVALVAAIGSRPSGGYSVTIPCVQATDVPGAIEVFVMEHAPGPGCVVTLALTAPIAIAKVPRPVTSATFHLTTHRYDCP